MVFCRFSRAEPDRQEAWHRLCPGHDGVGDQEVRLRSRVRRLRRLRGVQGHAHGEPISISILNISLLFPISTLQISEISFQNSNIFVSVQDAWNAEVEEKARRAEEKREKRVLDNWKRLIKGLLLAKKLKAKYKR